jgi:hypothetical protein
VTTGGGGLASHLFDDCSVALLCGLCGCSEQAADLGPGDTCRACCNYCVEDLALALSPRQCSTLQHVHLNWAFVVVGRFVVFESLSEFVGVVENLLDGSGHCGHLRNLGRAGMA